VLGGGRLGAMRVAVPGGQARSEDGLGLLVHRLHVICVCPRVVVAAQRRAIVAGAHRAAGPDQRRPLAGGVNPGDRRSLADRRRPDVVVAQGRCKGDRAGRQRTEGEQQRRPNQGSDSPTHGGNHLIPPIARVDEPPGGDVPPRSVVTLRP
jgi:hypothetical protein